MRHARYVLAAVLCLAVTACGGESAATSGPSSATSVSAAPVSLQSALASWRRKDPSLRSRPPADVLAAASRERALVHRLALEPPRTAARELASLPRVIAADVAAARTLRRLDVPPTGGTLHLVAPAPAGALLADYRAAQRRFHVAWQLLAAVNFVESAFGRVTSRSSAGAQGPMQFMPATWRAYGLGGNVHSPRDAIMGAANYLHRSGAPADNGRALYAYNPSHLYVSAVLAYARQMRDDPLGFLTYYSWEASLPSVLRG